jgi:uncharacterized delta-60 repeat protein
LDTVLRPVLIWLAVVLAAVTLAAPSFGAARPGTLDTQIGEFGRDRPLSIDTFGGQRILAGGISDGYPLYRRWIRAYRPGGGLDTSFAGDGVLDLGDGRAAVEVDALPDGRVVVTEAGGGYWEPEPHRITRLNADGTRDESFGSGGSIQPEFGDSPGSPYGTFLYAVVPDREGRLLVVGARTGGHIVVRRYLPDGSQDLAFGAGGETRLSGDPQSAAAAALTPDDGLVVTFPVERYPTVALLAPDGTLAPSSGPMRLAAPHRSEWVRRDWREPGSVVLADGGIRIPIAYTMGSEDEYRMALVGLRPDGQPDLDFGRGGLALGPARKRPGGETPLTALADASGSILLAGSVGSSQDFTLDDSGIIRRFRAEGSLDRSFGRRGAVPTQVPAGGYSVITQSLALLDPERVVAAEWVYDGKYGFWGGAAMRTLHAGYDLDDPSISIRVRSCRSARVKIEDLSALEAVVARTGSWVVRRTTRKRFRVRTRRGGRRVSVRATDLAGNSSRKAVRLPRC